MFADICSSASPTSPHIALSKFFALYQVIDQPSSSKEKLQLLQTNDKPSTGPPPLNGKNTTRSPSKPPQPTEQLLSLVDRFEWSKGHGTNDVRDVREMLLHETRSWFLKFLDAALDTGFRVEKKIGKDHIGRKSLEPNNHIAVTLSQLKQANEWLDKLKGSVHNISAQSEDYGVLDRVDKLKKKVYACLLVHIDSAAFALESRSDRKS